MNLRSSLIEDVPENLQDDYDNPQLQEIDEKQISSTFSASI